MSDNNALFDFSSLDDVDNATASTFRRIAGTGRKTRQQAAMEAQIKASHWFVQGVFWGMPIFLVFTAIFNYLGICHEDTVNRRAHVLLTAWVASNPNISAADVLKAIENRQTPPTPAESPAPIRVVSDYVPASSQRPQTGQLGTNGVPFAK